MEKSTTEKNGQKLDEDFSEERERTLYVANLDEKVSDEMLYELFIQVGPVDRVSIVEPKFSSGTRIAFVVFDHKESVKYSIEAMGGLITLYHKPVTIKPRAGTEAEKQYLEEQSKRRIKDREEQMQRTRDAYVTQQRHGMTVVPESYVNVYHGGGRASVCLNSGMPLLLNASPFLPRTPILNCTFQSPGYARQDRQAEPRNVLNYDYSRSQSYGGSAPSSSRTQPTSNLDQLAAAAALWQQYYQEFKPPPPQDSSIRGHSPGANSSSLDEYYGLRRPASETAISDYYQPGYQQNLQRSYQQQDVQRSNFPTHFSGRSRHENSRREEREPDYKRRRH